MAIAGFGNAFNNAMARVVAMEASKFSWGG